MADRDATQYEPNPNGKGLQQKPVSLQPPPKQPMENSFGRSDLAKSHDGNGGGYYSNVVQKAKLILPTALWAMLIIAGICFLILLASLNRTIDTLDTLVEIEQEREARAGHFDQIHSHHNQHHGKHHMKAAGLDSPPNRRDDEMKEARKRKDGVKGKHKLDENKGRPSEGPFERPGRFDLDFSDSDDPPFSWLALPSWTSLEPRHREQRPQLDMPPPPHEHSPLSSPMGFFDDIMRAMSAPLRGNGPEQSESMSTIIVTSPIMEGPEGRPSEASASGFMSSIINQMLPIFDNLAGFATPRDFEPRREQVVLDRQPPYESDAPDPPLISAKIDKMDVHIINGPESGSEEQDRRRPRPPASEGDEINTIEKSIDELVSKLMERRSSSNGRPDRRRGDRSDIYEVAPIVRHQNRLEVDRNSDRPQPSPGPLMGLLRPLLGPESSDPAPIFIHAGDNDGHDDLVKLSISGPHPQRDSPMGLARRPIGKGRIHGPPIDDEIEPRLIVTIHGDDGAGDRLLTAFDGGDHLRDRIKTSPETDRHGLSKIRGPNFGQSPYEIPTPSLGDLIGSLDLGPKPSSPDEQSSGPAPHQVHGPLGPAAPWDLFANDLANSLVQDAVQQQLDTAAPQVPMNLDEPQILMFGDKAPLAPGERPPSLLLKFLPESLVPKPSSTPDAPPPRRPMLPVGPQVNIKANERHHPIEDMMSLLLAPRPVLRRGPESGAKQHSIFGPDDRRESAANEGGAVTFGAQSLVTSSPVATSSVATQTNSTTETSDSASTGTAANSDATATPTIAEILATAGPTLSSTPSVEQHLINATPSAESAVTKEEEEQAHAEVEDVLNTIMGDMFTLPQFSGDPRQASTPTASQSSSGGAQAKLDVTTDATTSQRVVNETMEASTSAKDIKSQGQGITDSPARRSEHPSPSPNVGSDSTAKMGGELADKLKTVTAVSLVPTSLSAASTMQTSTTAEKKSVTDSAPTFPQTLAPLDGRLGDKQKTLTFSTNGELHAAASRDPIGTEPDQTTTQSTTSGSPVSTSKPPRSFLQKADDFFERNFQSLKRLIN